MLGPMLLTDDELRELGPLAKTGPIYPINAHQVCLDLFCALFDELRATGWTPWRLDTYRHPEHGGFEIKHQYVAGTWEIHMFYLPIGDQRTATIRRDRPLPTIRQLLDDLFGPRRHLYHGTLLDPPAAKKLKKGSKTS